MDIWLCTRSGVLKWPSKTELLAVTDECVGVALCVYLDGWLGARQTTYSKTNYL